MPYDEPADTMSEFLRNMNRYRDSLNVCRGLSAEVAAGWSRPVDLLFIDGDHSYEGVKRDWDLFVPFVKPFGIVVFHDTTWEVSEHRLQARPDMGVPRFVDELREAGYPVLTIDRDYGVSLVQPTLGGQPLRRQLAGTECVAELNMANISLS